MKTCLPVYLQYVVHCIHSVVGFVFFFLTVQPVYSVKAKVFVGFINLHIFLLQAAVVDGGSAAARAPSPPLIALALSGPLLEASP